VLTISYLNCEGTRVGKTSVPGGGGGEKEIDKISRKDLHLTKSLPVIELGGLVSKARGCVECHSCQGGRLGKFSVSPKNPTRGKGEKFPIFSQWE